jgi:hypothetical protein
MATVSRSSAVTADYRGQALYYDPANAFDFRWPPVPRRQFLAEREQAFATAAPSGLVPLDASDALETPYPATTPSLLAQYLRLRAGERFTTRQRAHRHNGVAITLALEGEGVYSLIEDERVDWVTGAAQVTPAAELHSHHNRGTRRMRSLVIQDEGLHYYTRTPGFSWD